MDKISFSKFKKLLTCQPYFVWHSLDTKEEEEDDNLLSFDMPSFIDEAEVTLTQVQAKSFAHIQNKFNEVYGSKPGAKLVISKTLEDKVKETQDAITNPDVKLIINPSFAFEYKDHQVFASPSIYDKQTNKVSFLKLSGSTKRADLLRIIFDCLVLEKLGVKIDAISLIVIATQEYKKGEVNFFETFYTNTSTSSRTDKNAKGAFDFLSMQLAKAGMGQNAKGVEHEEFTIFNIFKNKKLDISKKEDFPFFDIEYYLDKIIAAKDSTQLVQPQEIDASIWGFNKAWVELVKKFLPQYEGISGNIVSKQNIIALDNLEDIEKESITLYQIRHNNSPVLNDKEAVLKMIGQLNKKVVWYDFEAFSIPICPLDGFLPFQQVVSQVSIIRTDNFEEVSKDNIVIDPLKISHDNLFDIVKAIYRKDHKYVVYNDSYENSRLREIAGILERYDHPNAEEAKVMVEEIIENTIDLAKAFAAHKNKLPWIMVPELKGKHSIKLLEKYITNYRPDVTYKIKEYKSLDVQNGMMAMELANNRALDIIGDNEWEIKVPKLKEYCENDVRAMIMVYYLIKELVK